MAKQTGPNPFTGRRGDLLGYRIGQQYYVRVVSSLSAKRVKQDPAFRLTMRYASLLGQASGVASAIYRQLQTKDHGFYRKLTGMAMHLLKQGQPAEEVFEQLEHELIPAVVPVEVPRQKNLSATSFTDELLNHLFSQQKQTLEIGQKQKSWRIWRFFYPSPG